MSPRFPLPRVSPQCGFYPASMDQRSSCPCTLPMLQAIGAPWRQQGMRFFMARPWRGPRIENEQKRVSNSLLFAKSVELTRPAKLLSSTALRVHPGLAGRWHGCITVVRPRVGELSLEVKPPPRGGMARLRRQWAHDAVPSGRRNFHIEEIQDVQFFKEYR
jgi:hypothetical protein